MGNQEIVVLSKKPDLPFSQTGGWNYLRLLLGNKKADDSITKKRDTFLPKNFNMLNEIEQRIAIRTANRQSVQFLLGTVDHSVRDDLQFIVKNEREVINVATNKHSLISVKEVKEHIIGVLQDNGMDIRRTWDRYPAVFSLTKETEKLKFDVAKIGLGIYFGNIVLTKSIRISWYFELVTCTNPLTFLALRNTSGINNLYLDIGNVRRLGNESNILEKTEEAVLEGIKQYRDSNVKAIFNKNGAKQVTMKQASYLVGSMCNAYQVGVKTQNEILDTYTNQTKTAWNLAMTISKIARDEDNFRSDSRSTTARLSAIGLVILTSRNMTHLISGCREYYNKHNLTLLNN